MREERFKVAREAFDQVRKSGSAKRASKNHQQRDEKPTMVNVRSIGNFSALSINTEQISDILREAQQLKNSTVESAENVDSDEDDDARDLKEEVKDVPPAVENVVK